MLTCPHRPPDETLTLPLISALTTPYAFSHPPLPSLCSGGALTTCLCHRLPSLHASDTANHPYACVVPSQHASNTTYDPYACGEPSQHASDTTYNPYACGEPSQHAFNTASYPYACVVPSQHASDTANHPYACLVPSDTTYHPYACVVPSWNASNTAYHPYACVEPSQHASNTAYHPYAHGVPSQHACDTALNPPYASVPPPLTILTLLYYIHSVRWLVGIHNQRNQGNMLSGLLCQQDLRGNWSVYSQCCAFISAQPPSSQKPNFKSYEKENTVGPCAPTKDAGQDDVIFSGEVEIISKEQFVSNIAQTIPRLEKIPDYVHQKIAEAMSLLKMDLNCNSITNSIQKHQNGCLQYMGRQRIRKRPNIHATKKTNKKCRTFEAAKDSLDQGDEMINVKVGHIDNQPPHTESPPILKETLHDEPPHTESPPILNETIHDKTPPASPQNIQAFQERETLGQDMTDIIPDPEPKVSSSAIFQGIFLAHMEEFGYILNYHSNITQQSWKRGLDNINRI
ncbi:hypothetical protein O181_008613 [Austropuccinia psidii MF-1]|uniref:Uncharacterized protein n=1 Tax=Austropuccinia psidii MF-1 TaxID=1389203 RepID=A0A9Q3BPR8_9BASI|nr:hypothetical protein [Austropuccinia psidii MF-1]